MRASSHAAVALLEVVLALAILVAAMVPLLSMTTSGRRSAEHNARRYQALLLAERVLDDAALRGGLAFDSLVSEETPAGVTADDGSQSRYLRFFVGDRSVRLPGFAALEAQLDGNFAVTVRVTPDESIPDVRHVAVTVLFRLSPAHPTSHRLTLETYVARRSPL